MEGRITVVCKSWLDGSPTVLTLARTLRSLGMDVLCICSGCRRETRDDLESLGIVIREVYPDEPHPKSVMGKVRHYRTFGQRAWRLVRDDETLLWVAKIDTAIAMGRRLCGRRYILSLHELHDRYPLYQRAIRYFARRACQVVTPEYCRAAILRCQHGLNHTPFVLPNRPRSHPRRRKMPISDNSAARILNTLEARQRILLYQGNLGSDRDLRPVARAIRELGEDYCFLVMGSDATGALGELKDICPRLVHIPWVIPPRHLEVTSHAFIGIAFYRFDALNSIFCAPNKIWEYTGFGVPMLCQDIPGLRYSIGVTEAGVCVNTSHSDEILAGIKELEQRYDHYSGKAAEFYDSVDTEQLVAQLMASVA